MHKKTEQELREWLKDDTQCKLESRFADRELLYVKVPAEKGFAYLYAQGAFQKNIELQKYPPLQCMGIYSPKEECVYATGEFLGEEYPELVAPKTMKEIETEMVMTVRCLIDNTLNSNGYRLSVTELPEQESTWLKTYNDCILPHRIKKAICTGIKSEDIRHESEYETLEESAKQVMGYIDNPMHFVQNAAKEYIKNNQVSILLKFKETALLKDGIAEIEEEMPEKARRMQEVYRAMEKLGRKTARVTLEKDGRRISFDYKFSKFQYTFDFVTPNATEDGQRRFSPEYVTEISHKYDRVYSAEPYIPEQDIGMRQTM